MVYLLRYIDLDGGRVACRVEDSRGDFVLSALFVEAEFRLLIEMLNRLGEVRLLGGF